MKIVKNMCCCCCCCKASS